VSDQARLGLQKDGLHLYRSVLSPQLPRLGFVGSEVSTLNNVLTSGLQAVSNPGGCCLDIKKEV
jgi:dimethylaniline monooxygenase (N-oxide forming)